MFDHSSNIVINGGQFTDIGNNHDAVSTILLHHVAPGAIFDSAERHSAGRCHPGTRERMLDRVKEWLQRKTPDSEGILWMYGPAGAGKSSLMQSVCEFLRDSEPETNGASFFFSRGDQARGKATHLFVTLAYQLAVQLPSLRAEINDALHRDSTLPTKSLAIQLRTLIIDPLRRCKTIPSRTPILLIDGLDECDADDNQGEDTQRQIINLISQSLMENEFPIRVIIASRPEYWIRDSFESSPLYEITHFVSLRDDFDADRDIKTYLTETFEQIRLKKRRIMKNVELPWPAERIINKFVEEASGQYIYASTVLKFVGNHPFKNPADQLLIIITPGPHQACAYSELDRLYATILSVYPESGTLLRVLGGLIVGLNFAAIQVFLEVPRSEIILVLDALSSLIEVVPPKPLPEEDQPLIPIFGSSFEDEKIVFFHSSFREFLQYEARSGMYHIDIHAVHMKVITGFFGVIQRNLDANYETEPHILCTIDLLEYRRMMEAVILHVAPQVNDSDIQHIVVVLTSLMERFCRFDPGCRMNQPACFLRDMDSISFFLSEMDPPILTKAQDDSPTIEQDTAALEDFFLAIVSQVEELALVAREIGIRLLSLCNGFAITNTLFYIGYLHQSDMPIRIHQLSMLPGVTVDDSLLTIRQHCHIIDFRTRDPPIPKEAQSPAWLFLYDLGWILEPRLDTSHTSRLYWPVWTNYGVLIDLDNNIDEASSWISHQKRINQYSALACLCLRSILDHGNNKWEHMFGHKSLDPKEDMVTRFFNDTLSDIGRYAYIKYEHHLSLLEVMFDFKAWTALRVTLRSNLHSIIVPVLCWFNRQLVNPSTSKFIKDCDPSLPLKMRTAMNIIFHECFVPTLTTVYFSGLINSLYSHIPEERKTIKINVSSTSYFEEVIDYCPVEDHQAWNINRIQRQLFEQGAHPYPNAKQYVELIPHSEWYCYFVPYLLNIYTKYLHSYINPKFGPARVELEQLARPLFPHIIRCLPYGQTTPQNLDALRAIKFLSLQVGLKEAPSWLWKTVGPLEFCSAVGEFLERYKPSVLSSAELSDFALWFQSIQEGVLYSQTEYRVYQVPSPPPPSPLNTSERCEDEGRGEEENESIQIKALAL